MTWQCFFLEYIFFDLVAIEFVSASACIEWFQFAISKFDTEPPIMSESY